MSQPCRISNTLHLQDSILCSSNSNLIVETGKKHHCHYGTPFGDFTVGIYAHTIENTLDATGGRLYLKYTVDINSSYISDNEIYLTI